MRKKDNKVNNSSKTSKGGYVFIGFIVLIVVGTLTIQQLRKNNEQRALNYGVDNICTITELSSNKTQFAEYSYQVDDKTFYSHRATPFDNIYPGEMFKMKYLKDEPGVNKILFEYPVVLDSNQSNISGYIEKIYNNKAVFHYKFKDNTYERWQLLRESHSLKQGDSIDIIVIATNPKIGILNY
jgi:hypothetical protein